MYYETDSTTDEEENDCSDNEIDQTGKDDFSSETTMQYVHFNVDVPRSTYWGAHIGPLLDPSSTISSSKSKR